MKNWNWILRGIAALCLSVPLCLPAQAAEALKVIRIGVATGGVGSAPVRHGGTSLALTYSQGVLEQEFAADGVKIDWVFFKGAGPAVNEALVNHQLDFAWQGDLPSIVHRAGGVKTRIVLGSGVRTGLYLAVRPGSGIRGIADLRGRKVGVFKGTNLHLTAARALQAYGLQERDVRLLNLDTAAGKAALANGDVDAVFDYVGLFELRDQGLAEIVWSAAADSYRYTRQTALLVTDDFATRHPQAVARVVKAVVRTAHEWSDESRRDALFAAWGETEYPAAIWQADFVDQPLAVRLSPLLDPFLVERYVDAARQAHELKLIRRLPEVESWFDRSWLDAALQELGLTDYWPVFAADGSQL